MRPARVVLGALAVLFVGAVIACSAKRSHYCGTSAETRDRVYLDAMELCMQFPGCAFGYREVLGYEDAYARLETCEIQENRI